MAARWVSVMLAAMLLAGCGSNTEQRAATASLTGIGIGALAGGPLGALIGAGIGGAAGAAAPEGLDQLARRGFGSGDVELAEPQPLSGATGPTGAVGVAPGGGQDDTNGDLAIARVSTDTAQRIQEALKARGLYDGPIDGMLGARTRAGLAAYRVKHGKPPWPVLDVATLIDLIGPPAEGETLEGGSQPTP